MLKKLILIASLFSTLALAASPPTNVEQAYNEIRNQGVNPGAEQGKSGWMVSGGSGTFQIDTDATHARDGKQSFMLSGFGSGVFWEMQAALTMPQAQSCTAKIYYYGGDANWSFQVYDMSGNLLGSQTLATQTSYTTAIVPFQCTAPSSGAYIALQALAATPAAIHVDSTFLGETPLAQVSQATYVGGVIVPSGCAFDQSGSGGYADMTNVGSCSGFALVGQAASFDAAGNGSVTFNNLPPGEYMASFQGTCNRGNASTNDAKFVTTDGSSFGTAFDLGTGAQVGGFTMTVPCILYAHFTYSGAANRNFKVQVNPSASDNFTINQTGGISGEFFSLYRYPSASDLAVRADTQNWLVDAIELTSSTTNLGTSSVGSQSTVVDSGGTVAFTINPTSTVAVQVPCSGGNPSTGTSCSSGNPEFGVAPYIPSTGKVLACVDFDLETGSVSAGTVAENFWLVQTNDASETPIGGNTHFRVGNNGQSGATPNFTQVFPYHMCEVISIGSVGKTNFKLQYISTLSGSTAQNSIIGSHWIVRPYTQNVTAPVLVGGVRGPEAGVPWLVRGNIFCGPSSGINVNYGNSVASVSNINTPDGSCLVSFSSGVFTDNPVCTANKITDGNGGSSGTVDEIRVSPGMNTLTTKCFTGNGAIQVACSQYSYEFLCTGQH